MSNVNIEYAWKNDKRYHISDSFVKTGDRFYFINGDLKYEVCPHKGIKKAHSFHAMPGVIIDANISFHKDCQYYLQDQKKIEIDNLIIYADKVLLEVEAANYIKKTISDYSMIPDCLFLDSEGNIICIVEVFVTHFKDENDKIKIKNYKINTIELNYGKTKNNYKEFDGYEWLYLDSTNQEDRDKGTRIKDLDITIKNLEGKRDSVSNIDERIRDKKRELEGYNSEMEYFNERIKSQQ
jgi:hypothetical protein